MSALPNRFDYMPPASAVPSVAATRPLQLVIFDNQLESSPSRMRGMPHPATGFRRLEPTPELLAELAAASSRLETGKPEEIIAWGVEHYAPYLTMATAFGPEGCVI